MSHVSASTVDSAAMRQRWYHRGPWRTFEQTVAGDGDGNRTGRADVRAAVAGRRTACGARHGEGSAPEPHEAADVRRGECRGVLLVRRHGAVVPINARRSRL